MYIQNIPIRKHNEWDRFHRIPANPKTDFDTGFACTNEAATRTEPDTGHSLGILFVELDDRVLRARGYRVSGCCRVVDFHLQASTNEKAKRGSSTGARGTRGQPRWSRRDSPDLIYSLVKCLWFELLCVKEKWKMIGSAKETRLSWSES